MKKILLIALGAFAFACSDSADNTTTGTEDTAAGDAAITEDVEIGSGEEISPQFELDSGENRRLEVDTLSRETAEEQQQ